MNAPKRIAIIGGGPGGTSCALALSQAGFQDITIWESGNYDRFRIGESVPPEIRAILSKLGLMQDFIKEKHEPCYGSCSYWGDDRRGYNDSIMSVYGHGWHLDRRRFDRFLADAAAKAGVQVAMCTRFVSAQPRPQGGFTLKGRQGEKPRRLEADFVVDASGAGAVFARAAGAKRLEDRPLICTGMRFAQGADTPITGLTHLEAVSNGWWYAARLPQGQMLLTLTTDAATLKQGGYHQMEPWYEALRATPNTHRLIEDATPLDSELKRFPAPSHRMSIVAGPRWLALGDAATAYDPITSQGIIKAVSGALLAAETIAKTLNGQPEGTARYAQAITASFRQYLTMRDHFYQQEQRFPNAPFWRHMQGKQAAQASTVTI